MVGKNIDGAGMVKLDLKKVPEKSIWSFPFQNCCHLRAEDFGAKVEHGKLLMRQDKAKMKSES